MIKYIVLVCFLLLSNFSFSQEYNSQKVIWDGFYSVKENDVEFKFPLFSKECYDINVSEKTITFSKVIPVSQMVNNNSLQLINIVYENVNEEQLGSLDKNKIPSKLVYSIGSVKARDNFFAYLSVSPIIKENGVYKRITSFNYTFNLDNSNRNNNVNSSALAISNSVLASGSWYKFYVQKSGIYKLTKSFLKDLGLDTNVNPKNIKIYGNGGRMLPLLNSTYYPLDLEENAIKFIGEDDEIFNDDDYILFYAEGVDQWNTESFTSNNLFEDKSYYFVTVSNSQGKRITEATQPTDNPTQTYTNYDDYLYYEKDLVNFGKVGRRWWGEQFNINNEQTFDFSIPNIDTSVPINVKINTASKSFTITKFNAFVNNQSIGTATFPSIDNAIGVSGFENVITSNFSLSNGNFSVKLEYDNGSVPSSNGYLDYIQIKSTRLLQGFNNQFSFFNESQAANIGTAQYSISNAIGIASVWDITDIYNVFSYTNNNSSSFAFKAPMGEIRKYITQVPSDYYSPLKESNAQVANQNLKGTLFKDSSGNFADIDYLIITPQFLVNQANTLANFHRNNSNLQVRVVTLESIYLEFGSGKQDVAAIRNLIRYVYQNASSNNKRVKYVNLFGDASYDYKNRIFNNNNIVPVFHGFNTLASENNNISNLSTYLTFMSDDFYGLMDNNEGTMPTIGNTSDLLDGIDIAVGRMPVSTTTQAAEMVNKIIEYHDIKSYGRWRNSYVIFSDDADNSTDATLQFALNDLSDVIAAQKPFINVKKIHTDSYAQEISSGGERYPSAKKDFLDAIELGALVVNYYGHGGEESLARERLFEKADAQNLNNRYRYPLFITITCEFTRFDDPNRPTGGEYMYWNKAGGAVAMVATTRQIAVSVGEDMNIGFAENLFNYGLDTYPTIADAVRLTKITTASTNRRVVFFIGDPAMYLAIPKQKVILTKVNDVPITQPIDNFQALSLMKVSGEVVDENNILINDYNGDLAVQIFDKNYDRQTLGNNGFVSTGTSYGGTYFPPGQLVTMTYNTLGETIFRGNASVNNGAFEFSFIVPQDIKIPLGNGRISFYAKRQFPYLDNQTGYDATIKVGGVNPNAAADNTPPTVKLYMNDESFVSGSVTDCSPILYAILQDENGINTASGIGHDIVAILDGDESNPYILNDYYETENDNYTKGYVRFPFRDLSSGWHTVLLKVWDVYNNLTTLEIQFNAVCSEDGMRLERVLNYPNPFTSYTEFWFTHNHPNDVVDVQVQILTISGKLVKTINKQVLTQGYLCREVSWNGLDDFGDKIGKGVYIYKLTVRSTTTGKSAHKYEKLVIL